MFLIFTETANLALKRHSIFRQSVGCLHCLHITYEPCHGKTCLCYMRTTKTQISLRIHAVWLAFLLFTASSFYTQNFKTLASFCGWAGPFESHLVTNPLNTGFLLTWPIYCYHTYIIYTFHLVMNNVKIYHTGFVLKYCYDIYIYNKNC